VGGPVMTVSSSWVGKEGSKDDKVVGGQEAGQPHRTGRSRVSHQQYGLPIDCEQKLSVMV
jgi:hypothetical protein